MLQHRIQQHFIDSADLKYQVADALSAPIARAIEAIWTAVTNDGKVLVCSDGGAAAAQYVAAQFVGRYERERPELAAMALAFDALTLSAFAADDGALSQVYAKQIKALGRSGDVLLLISSDARAAQVGSVIEAAHGRDMTVVALTGRLDEATQHLLGELDVHIGVSHERTSRIQEVHLTALHCICDGVDALLLGDADSIVS